MTLLAIARVNLRRFLHDRRNVFEALLLPVLLIVLLGAMQEGSDDVRLGVVDHDESALSSEMIARLDDIDGIAVHEYGTESAMVDRVERGRLDAGLIVAAGYHADLESGATAEIRAVVTPATDLGAAQTAAEAVITEMATLTRAATYTAERGVAGFDEAFAMAEQWQATMPPVEVSVTEAGEPLSYESFAVYDIPGQTMLVLFTFFATLTGATALIESRRLGLTRRMYSTPTTTSQIIAGEALGRVGIGLVQGLVIMVGGAALFGIDWGDPLGAFLTLLTFSLVAAGVAMLLGSFFANQEQASGWISLVGMGLAVLGGATIPLYAIKYMDETLWKVAHISPHAWAIESFEELVAFDGSVVDIAPFLGILLGYAIVVFALATWRLRTVLTR
ncbi:MAG: ABC transporter permease [Ilumatobacter sp.]|uniref:ABC transporter permease n=1 Tax=Ilumatobacter sp. TaxID=1967498 RepID=UPI002634389B|nr:ABC transporter permease [Ilumatobacter sp.]MDJ0771553.1 ABC transporter permease [Ilumatobacter sp.]